MHTVIDDYCDEQHDMFLRMDAIERLAEIDTAEDMLVAEGGNGNEISQQASIKACDSISSIGIKNQDTIWVHFTVFE
jgi:hypothetical protein